MAEVCSPEKDMAEKEAEMYMQKPCNSNETDPLPSWMEKECIWGGLVKVAARLLSDPQTSVLLRKCSMGFT